jgi:hypothetical protein
MALDEKKVRAIFKSEFAEFLNIIRKMPEFPKATISPALSDGVKLMPRERKPLRTYELDTDTARNWEEHNWQGDHFAVLRNDTSDLKVMFDSKGAKEDIIPIPKITFGGTQVTIEYGQELPLERRKKFDRVYLNHSAVAAGKIVIIVGGAASVYSTTSGGAVIIDGYPYNDYAEIAFTAAQQAYSVGTNAVVARPGTWPPAEAAKRTRLWSTRDCYVRYNYANAVQHLIDAGREHLVKEAWKTLYIVRVANDGVLRLWIEG